MKERGILFSAEMVRAILAGTKTQTRRVLVPKTPWSAPGHEQFAGMGNVVDGYAYALFKTPWEKVVEGWKEKPPVDWTHETKPVRCPYGAPGDRLWVRETWRVQDASEAEIRYAADGSTARYLSGGDAAFWKRWREKSHLRNGGPAWCPSIYLPRWASRITLDVLSIRVERLHDISEEDARAEGVTVRDNCGCPCACHGPAENPGPHLPECLWHATDLDPWEEPAKASFAALWRSINGADSWDANPWVWRIEFRRVTP